MDRDEVDKAAAARGRLIQTVSKRGYNGRVAVALALAGCLPAAALVVVRPAGLDSTPLIAALFVAVPALVLLTWVRGDREAQDAREVVMWLRTTSRSGVDLPEAADAAFADLQSGEASIKDTADDVRDALAPLVASPASLGRRIAVYRNWYPVVWIVLSLLLVIVFLVVMQFTPACGPAPAPGTICH